MPCNDDEEKGETCRTKARVAWKVVLYFSNRASICSHALILLSPTRWSVMTGWRTSISLQPFVQTRLDIGSLLYTSIGLHPVFQTCFFCGSLSAHVHQYPSLCVSSTVFQTRVDVSGSGCLHRVTEFRPITHFLIWTTGVHCCGPCLFCFVCVHASVPDPGSLSVHSHPFPALCKHI